MGVHCCPGKLASALRKRLSASEISGFDAGNDLKAGYTTPAKWIKNRKAAALKKLSGCQC